jgi:hypothetical protein
MQAIIMVTKKIFIEIQKTIMTLKQNGKQNYVIIGKCMAHVNMEMLAPLRMVMMN